MLYCMILYHIFTLYVIPRSTSELVSTKFAFFATTQTTKPLPTPSMCGSSTWMIVSVTFGTCKESHIDHLVRLTCSKTINLTDST